MGAAAKYLQASRLQEFYRCGICKQDHYFEVNSCFFSLVPALRVAFPDCKIIGLLRDGRDVVRSGRNIGWYKNDDYWEPLRLRSYGNEDIVRYWAHMNHVEQCTWYWTEMITAFACPVTVSPDLPDPPKVDLLVKLEELVGDTGHSTWGRMAVACGLPGHDPLQYVALKNERQNVTPNATVPPFADWPQSEQDDFWKWARPLMERLSYV